MSKTNYFQSYQNHFWQYEENGEVIAVPHGPTIAYAGLIADLIESLYPQPLPPFGVVLMCLAATHPDNDRTLRAVIDHLGHQSGGDAVDFDAAVNFLTTLTQLPLTYKEGPKKTWLLKVIFANCHNTVSSRIIKPALTTWLEEGLPSFPAQYNSKVVARELRIVAMLHNQYPDVNTLLNELAGIPELEEELPALPSETTTEKPAKKELLEELLEHRKTFQPAALVRHLWSGLHIPLQKALPSQQAVGGFADLSNKGDFDKLLASEFAHDDLTLLSRLANNEALFLKRENPPADHQLERILLLDISLKSWGIPKIVAFAVALAMSQHPRSATPCTTYVVGNDFRKITLGSIHDVIDALQYIDTSLHPAEGLRYFLQKQKAENPTAEIMLLTPAETLLQPDMQLLLSQHRADLQYLILTDRTGQIDLYRHRQASRQHLQTIRLPLQQLWQKPPKQKPGKNKNSPFGDFPILFPTCRRPFRTLTTANQWFVITDEGGFMSNTPSMKNGWTMLIENLPPRNDILYEIGKSNNGHTLLLSLDRFYKQLTIYNLTTGERKKWAAKKICYFWPFQVFFWNDQFYIVHGHKSYLLVDFENGVSPLPFQRMPPEMITAFNTYDSSRDLAVNKIRKSRPIVLKNISDVFLNKSGKLILNKHAYRINEHGVIKLEVTNDLSVRSQSIREGNHFVFPDGSRISNTRSGVIVLKSSQPELPLIYLPTVLGASIGAATNSAFCGNTYYRPFLQHRFLNTLSVNDFWQKYVLPFTNSLK